MDDAKMHFHRKSVADNVNGMFRRSGGFIVIDTETTGFSSTDEICQFTALHADGTLLLNTLVRPAAPMSEGALDTHGLTPVMLATAPTWAEVYPQVEMLLGGQALVAYNMEFDWRLLTQTCQRHHVPVPRVAVTHCAMKLYARFACVYDWRKKDWRWHKLAVACRAMELPSADYHDAANDARQTLALLKAMAAYHRSEKPKTLLPV